MPTVLSKPDSKLMLILDSIKGLISSKKGKIGGLAIIAVVVALVSMMKSKPKKRGDKKKGINKKYRGKKGGKGRVDAEFLSRIIKLIKIVIPSLADPVLIDFVMLNISLVLRTILSIRIANQNGLIVKSIIQANFNQFLSNIGTLALFALPASFINSYLEYLNKKIALRFRENLNSYFHKRYIKDNMPYLVSTVDSRIPTPDQRLTQDIDKWANALSTLYSNFSKPTLDLILFSKKLSELLGWQGPMSLIGWYFVSAIILRFISPSFGKLTAQVQRYEGEFRASHTNLSQHSEEIAFYRGDVWEQKRANSVFDKLYAYSKMVATKRLFMGTFDSMLVKYGAVMVAYGVLGIPVFGSGKEEYIKQVSGETSSITRDYIRNSSLLISLSKAIGRIVISYKEVQNLAGYTTLVYEMKEVLDDLENEKYCRVFINKNHEHKKLVSEEDKGKLHPMVSGEIFEDDCIKLIDVPLKAPNGDLLAETPIRFFIKPGMSCLFIGPNGSGKSSLYRIVSHLWPLAEGKLHRPPKKDIFFLPQKPYLPPGTLRDQIIYPDLESKMSDEELKKIMDEVDLNHLYLRENKNFDSKKSWVDVLSGGERQKISFARIFYHKPKYALLDESSSAVSMDFEHVLYKKCKELEITMFTISQRSSLYEFHDYLLQFDGEGKWTFEKIIHDQNTKYDYAQI